MPSSRAQSLITRRGGRNAARRRVVPVGPLCPRELVGGRTRREQPGLIIANLRDPRRSVVASPRSSSLGQKTNGVRAVAPARKVGRNGSGSGASVTTNNGGGSGSSVTTNNGGGSGSSVTTNKAAAPDRA